MRAPTSPHILKRISVSLTLIASSALLISCGSSSSSSLASRSLDKVTGLWPSRVPVAEVRHKDLKKMASGKDRALAWNRSLNQWVYLPVDYNPPTLPEEQTFPIDGGLLPPLPSIQDSHGQLPEE